VILAPPPPAAISVSPARLELAAGGTATIRLANAGRETTTVVIRPAGFAVALRGRPSAEPRAPGWLHLRPRAVTLPPRGAAEIAVTAGPGPPAPGDHVGLVLLRTASQRGQVDVRLQVGVVVVMRVPGAIVHRLRVVAVRVRRRALDVVLANAGNVSERIGATRLRVVVRRRGAVVARLAAPTRELLPHSRGIVSMRWRGAERHGLTIVVAVDGARYVSRRS
jgi:hypothetical protein